MADLTPFEKVLAERGSQYGHFLCEACLQKRDARYENVFTRLIAIRGGEPKAVQSPLDFGEYLFTARCFELSEIAPIIQEQSPTFVVGGCTVTFPDAFLRPSMPRLCSNNTLSDWPLDLLELRSNPHSGHPQSRALVSHSGPRLFHDVYDGIQQYTGITISHNYNNAWIGSVLLILPDYRLRITEIAGRGQLLTVRLVRDSAPPDVRIQCLIDGAGGRQEISEAATGPEVTLTLTSPIEQIESLKMFITASGVGLLDYYDQTPLHHSGRTRWLTGSPRQDLDLLKEIRNGEGLNLEFKPFVRISKGENKTAELIETAIAFANAGGGTILLGVNNTGEIEGIERELRKVAKAQDLLNASTEYGQKIRTVMNDVTSARLDLDIQTVELAGHILLRIDVQELPFASKPAWKLDSKETWVRRGATNFRPDPGMIRDGFAQKPEGFGEPWGT